MTYSEPTLNLLGHTAEVVRGIDLVDRCDHKFELANTGQVAYSDCVQGSEW